MCGQQGAFVKIKNISTSKYHYKILSDATGEKILDQVNMMRVIELLRTRSTIRTSRIDICIAKIPKMKAKLTCSSFHFDGLNGSSQKLTFGGP